MAYNPARDTRNWYTRLMFAHHLANLVPVWGRSTGTGHPWATLFNRGGSPLCLNTLSRLDRALNGHPLLFGPTGAGKSAPLVTLLMQSWRYTALVCLSSSPVPKLAFAFNQLDTLASASASTMTEARPMILSTGQIQALMPEFSN